VGSNPTLSAISLIFDSIADGSGRLPALSGSRRFGRESQAVVRAT
jgi:hypothetical protein